MRYRMLGHFFNRMQSVLQYYACGHPFLSENLIHGAGEPVWILNSSPDLLWTGRKYYETRRLFKNHSSDSEGPIFVKLIPFFQECIAANRCKNLCMKNSARNALKLQFIFSLPETTSSSGFFPIWKWLVWKNFLFWKGDGGDSKSAWSIVSVVFGKPGDWNPPTPPPPPHPPHHTKDRKKDSRSKLWMVGTYTFHLRGREPLPLNRIIEVLVSANIIWVFPPNPL